MTYWPIYWDDMTEWLTSVPPCCQPGAGAEAPTSSLSTSIDIGL